jgi:ketosteroid isomerase-like protein
MSQENVKVVREIHHLWNSRKPASHLIGPDFEYVNPPNAVEPGTLRGRTSLRKVLDVYPDYHIDVERVHDAGENVVVVGLARGKSTSGVAIEERQGFVWTMHDGRAVMLRWFNDPTEALQAVGLAE